MELQPNDQNKDKNISALHICQMIVNSQDID